MGSCGVGFAPVRPGGESALVELMEGVEDIPGAVLAEGVTWGWESFADYMATIAATPRAIDVLAQAGQSSVDLAGIFRWVFGASAVFLLISITAFALMEERPLRGRSEGAPKV